MENNGLPLMGVVESVDDESVGTDTVELSIEVQTWFAHIFLILIGYIGCIAAGLLSGVYIYVRNWRKNRCRRLLIYPSLVSWKVFLSWYLAWGIGLVYWSDTGVLWGVHTTSLSWTLPQSVHWSCLVGTVWLYSVRCQVEALDGALGCLSSVSVGYVCFLGAVIGSGTSVLRGEYFLRRSQP